MFCCCCCCCLFFVFCFCFCFFLALFCFVFFVLFGFVFVFVFLLLLLLSWKEWNASGTVILKSYLILQYIVYVASYRIRIRLICGLKHIRFYFKMNENSILFDPSALRLILQCLPLCKFALSFLQGFSNNLRTSICKAIRRYFL